MAGSNEFYYKEGRKKQDAGLHDPILEAGNDRAITKVAIERAIARGASRKLAEKLYK